MQRTAGVAGQRFRNPRQDQPGGQQAVAGEKPEDAAPAQLLVQPATDDRRNGRGEGEEHHDMRHGALRLDAVEGVADRRPAGDETAAGGDALQHARQQQRVKRLGEGAEQRGEAVEQNRAEHDAATAEAVGDRTPEQRHRGEAGEVGAEGLRQQRAIDAQRRLDGGEGGQVGVDAEGADHRDQRHGQNEAARPVDRAGVGDGHAAAAGVGAWKSSVAALPVMPV